MKTMKRIGRILLVAGLGMACDRGLPTDNWNEELLKPEPNWRVPEPMPCAAGTPSQFAQGCTPQAAPFDEPPA